jgi:hypothetical protein
MFVCCECCVLSGRCLCDELITRPEGSYRLWCVVVCDLQTSIMRRPWLTLGRSAIRERCWNVVWIYKNFWKSIFRHIFGTIFRWIIGLKLAAVKLTVVILLRVLWQGIRITQAKTESCTSGEFCSFVKTAMEDC